MLKLNRVERAILNEIRAAEGDPVHFEAWASKRFRAARRLRNRGILTWNLDSNNSRNGTWTLADTKAADK